MKKTAIIIGIIVAGLAFIAKFNYEMGKETEAANARMNAQISHPFGTVAPPIPSSGSNQFSITTPMPNYNTTPTAPVAPVQRAPVQPPASTLGFKSVGGYGIDLTKPFPLHNN